MTDAVQLITDRVRERVRHDGDDPTAAATRTSQYVHEELRRYSERALGGSTPLLADENRAAQEIVASLTGFGALQPYLDDASIEEIWINAPRRALVMSTI